MVVEATSPLTERELQMCRYAAQGLTYREMAKLMDLSVNYLRVKAHRLGHKLDGAGTPRERMVAYWQGHADSP